MTEEKLNDLKGVERTLLLPLYGRYQMSKDESVNYHDKVAVDIIESIGFDFAPFKKCLNPLERCYFLDRANAMDYHCQKFLASNPCGNIINVGAGLDNALVRCNNEQVRWYDLDVPSIIELRQSYIILQDNQHNIAHSVFDTEWIVGVEDTKRPTLIVVPGVFNYFELDKVMTLIDELCSQFSQLTLVMDVMSDYLSLYFANQTVKKIEQGPAKLRWILDDSYKAWPQRVKSVIFHPFYQFLPKAIKLRFDHQIAKAIVKRFKLLQYCVISNH